MHVFSVTTHTQTHLLVTRYSRHNPCPTHLVIRPRRRPRADSSPSRPFSFSGVPGSGPAASAGRRTSTFSTCGPTASRCWTSRPRPARPLPSTRRPPAVGSDPAAGGTGFGLPAAIASRSWCAELGRAPVESRSLCAVATAPLAQRQRNGSQRGTLGNAMKGREQTEAARKTERRQTQKKAAQRKAVGKDGAASFATHVPRPGEPLAERLGPATGRSNTARPKPSA